MIKKLFKPSMICIVIILTLIFFNNLNYINDYILGVSVISVFCGFASYFMMCELEKRKTQFIIKEKLE